MHVEVVDPGIWRAKAGPKMAIEMTAATVKLIRFQGCFFPFPNGVSMPPATREHANRTEA